MRNLVYASFWIYGAVIMAVSGMLKLSAASGEELWLSVRDPVFTGFTLRMVMIGAGMIEIITFVITVMTRYMLLRYALICCVSGLMLSYRTYKWIIGASGTCNCLGNLPNAIGLKMQHGDLIALCLALSLFIGGWVCLLYYNARDKDSFYRKRTIAQ